MTEPNVAVIQVWSKGFRISQRTEEFQLVVPPLESSLDESESHLLDRDWGSVLPALYRLDDDARKKEFCLVVSPRAVMVVFVEASKDRHKRRSVVVVASTTLVDWREVDLLRVVSRSASLTRRYARTLGQTFDGAPERLVHQLKSGAFLSEREFDLDLEEPDTEQDWATICREVCRWRGVTGVATRHLLHLGANVFYGSPEEVVGLDVAGVLNPVGGEFVTVTNDLTLWAPPKTLVREEKASVSEPLREIDVSLQEIRGQQRALKEDHDRLAHQQKQTLSLVEASYQLMKAIWELLSGGRH